MRERSNSQTANFKFTAANCKLPKENPERDETEEKIKPTCSRGHTK